MNTTTEKYVINSDIAPEVPEGWAVVHHQKGGQFEWDASKASLFLSDTQKNGRISGNKLLMELASKPVLNACVLDYLVRKSYLIPQEWKGKQICFWGTIYRDNLGFVCVRYLFWNACVWSYDSRVIDWGWHDGTPAALRAD